MSHKVWWLAGVVVLGLAGSVVAYRGFHASASIARGSKASAPAEARAQNPAAPSDVQRLRSELALVQGQMVGLRDQVAEQKRPAAPTPTQQSEAPDPAALQERRAESARRWKEHMAEVAATFEQEPFDRNFATAALTAIDRALQSNPTLQALAGKPDCRAHTCRLEIQNDGSSAVSKQLPLFLQAVGRTLPRAQADHIDGENRQKTMVLYVSNGNPAMEPRR